MKLTSKRLIALIFGFSITAINASAPKFTSSIFSHKDPVTAQNLRVSLKGDNWTAEDIKTEHTDFHIALFGNPTVMAGFADGQVRDADSVRKRVKDSIEERFGKGKPHGLLTVCDDQKKPFMHVVAGGGDRSGTSEIAYAIVNELDGVKYWGKGYGTKVLTKVVQEWAPEVYKIGHGTYPGANSKIVTAFQCFGGKEGSKALDQLDATASPSNPASWKILDKLAFEPAKCNLESTTVVIDYEHKEFASLITMEEELLKLYDASTTSLGKTLEPGKRYRMIDPDGKVRTVSKHARGNRMKYHFENTTFMN